MRSITLGVQSTQQAREKNSTSSDAEMERSPDDLYTPIYDENTTERIKKEFSRLRDEHYLDHSGATLYSDTQMKRVSNDMLTSLYGNPHSAGTDGSLTHEIIERTRYRLLDHFHASPDDYHLVFTSGATGSLKIIAETFRFGDAKESSGLKSGNFLYMQDNHTSVLGMRDVVSQRGAKVSCLHHKRAFDIFSSDSESTLRKSEESTNSLFVYSAQCNFSGLKYPLRWIRQVHDGTLSQITGDDDQGNWYVLLDAAGYVGTNDLDLSTYKPDFVVLSFYKMFGYPTGVGALLVKKTSASVLDKVYYGGGTVNLALSLENFHVKREVFHERFEDGTLSFLSIISLQHGLDAMSIVPLEKISRHVFSLARYLHHSLMTLRHFNNKPVTRIYCDTNYEDHKLQGGIVSFNLLRSNGEYVGYSEIVHMSSLYKLHLRTGCFCNPGACQRHLSLSDVDVLANYEVGYTCGGSRDLIDGKPTGAVRISFGYMSKRKDVDALLLMIKKCFINGPEAQKVPNGLINFQSTIEKKSCTPSEKIVKKNGTLDHDDFVPKKDFTIVEKSGQNVVYDIGKNEIFKEFREYDRTLRLSRLFIYPIKSCAAYEVTDSWLLGERGLQYDREWMIVTSAGVCLSQKQQVKLCLLRPQICREKNILVLNYPGMPTAHVPLDFRSDDIMKGELCRSRICGHRVEGIDCGADISEWLSLALGRPNLRLLRQNITTNLAKDPTKPGISFSSQAQYLLINEASVQWIIDKLANDSDCSRETILHRFRGNMVLNSRTPFEETTWSQIQIGKHKFQVDGPCTRCQMICIDQTTGKKTAEPLRLIAEEFHGKVRFGVYLSRQGSKPAIIKIGDPIIGI